MKILVLGGTGSIGSAVVQALLQRHHEVVAIGRSVESRNTLERFGAISVSGDIRDLSAGSKSATRLTGLFMQQRYGGLTWVTLIGKW